MYYTARDNKDHTGRYICMTLIFKVNRQGHNICFIRDPRPWECWNQHQDQVCSMYTTRDERGHVGVSYLDYFTRSSNEDRIFSLSPLDSLSRRRTRTKIPTGRLKFRSGGIHFPLWRPKVDFYLGRPRVNNSLWSPSHSVSTRSSDSLVLSIPYVRSSLCAAVECVQR